jgi:hypothetical protein
MVKRTATIVGLLLTFALAAFATPSPNTVPEPGSLLVFGTGLLLCVRSLKNKL